MRLHVLVDDLETARVAADGGATVLQLRMKDVPTDELVERARPFRALAHERGLTFIVNDDVEAALRLDADGVHLGQGDEGIDRAMEGGLMLGLSAATLDQAREAAELADYVGAGPVWATPSKPDAEPPIGLGGLAEIAAAVSVSVVAIGGVDTSNARACIEAGASGVAVIRAARDALRLRLALDGAAR